MLRKSILSAAILGTLVLSTPASATWGGRHTHHCGCGHTTCSSSSSGGSTSTGSTSGGTQVPEPGMLGMAGAGLIALGAMRQRRRKQA